MNNHLIGINKSRIRSLLYADIDIFKTLIPVKFCCNFYNVPADVLSDDGLLSQANFPLKLFSLCFLYSFKFEIAKPRSFYHIDLNTYPVVLNSGDKNLHFRK